MSPGSDHQELQARLRVLMREALQVEVPAAGTDLLDAGLIDSLGLVTLITEMEVGFGFEVPLDELDVERFRTLEAMAAFVAENLVTPVGGVEGKVEGKAV